MAKAPLVLALAQVKFDPILAMEQQATVARFQQADHMKSSYRALDPVASQQIVFQVSAQGAPTPASPGAQSQTLWRFRNRSNPDWIVSVSSSSLAIEATSYHDFDHFSSEWENVLSSFCSVFEPNDQLRFGLRYINQIELKNSADQRKLDRYINPVLLSPIGSELGNAVERSLSELRFRERNGVVAIRHGLIDAEPRVPAQMGISAATEGQKKAYLLDFDYFTETVEPFNPGKIEKRTVNYHDTIERLFAWALAPDYLNRLRKGDSK